MYALLPYFGVLLGVGIVLFVVIKNIPASGDEELIALYKRLSPQQYISHTTLEKVDHHAALVLEKFLRKTRVFLLKAERFVSVRLHGLREVGKREGLLRRDGIETDSADQEGGKDKK